MAHHQRGAGHASVVPTDLRWPEGIYSLSHLSLPFPADDPLYGADAAGSYNLGSLGLRGERGLLRVSAEAQLRLRWNPFYPWLESRVLDFVRNHAP